MESTEEIEKEGEVINEEKYIDNEVFESERMNNR
jgi:hypothetical protein